MKSKAVSLPGGIRRSAFTLIELLVVIAIIAILAGLLLQVGGWVQEKAGNARAQGQIKAMELALNNYKIDNGTYPEGSGLDDSTLTLLNAIDPDPSTTPNAKVYFAVPTSMMDSNNSTDPASTIRTNAKQLLDPFGNPYRYFYKATDAQAGIAAQNPATGSQNNGPTGFDLWSYGKAGATANASLPAKWIKNW